MWISAKVSLFNWQQSSAYTHKHTHTSISKVHHSCVYMRHIQLHLSLLVRSHRSFTLDDYGWSNKKRFTLSKTTEKSEKVSKHPIHGYCCLIKSNTPRSVFSFLFFLLLLCSSPHKRHTICIFKYAIDQYGDWRNILLMCFFFPASIWFDCFACPLRNVLRSNNNDNEIHQKCAK